MSEGGGGGEGREGRGGEGRKDGRGGEGRGRGAVAVIAMVMVDSVHPMMRQALCGCHPCVMLC